MVNTLMKILIVGMGGFIGAALRYVVALIGEKAFKGTLPYSTLLVNVVGGILIGLVMEMSLSGNSISPQLRLFLTTGILGGLTTFSTFSYETIRLFNSGSYVLGLLNIMLNLFLSLGGVVLGKYIGSR